LHAVLADLDDVSSTLRGVAEGIEEDPGRLAEIRVRRQMLRDLCRKYGDDLSEVMGYHATAQDRLRSLEHFDQRALELDRLRHDAMEAERREAQAVGRRRRTAAPLLAEAVEQRLRGLAMPSASIAVRVGDGPDDDPGDRVEFLLSANPGSPMLPLARVASGGELARAMLALRLVLSGADADGGGGATLVFDEVDAGIGGAAASAVASALGALAGEHQVLVVTHLAQVAAIADHQVVVAKEVRDGSTFASAEVVEGDVRVSEVARMLAGDDSDAARSHARTLLARP
jgi:DNA repair protein RecN (Recombination protein N)